MVEDGHVHFLNNPLIKIKGKVNGYFKGISLVNIFKNFLCKNKNITDF